MIGGMGSAAGFRAKIWERDRATVTPRPSTVVHRHNVNMQTNWAVCRVYDDMRDPVLVREHLTPQGASRIAGEMRDRMTDVEVGAALAEGWTFGPVRVRGFKATAIVRP